MQIFLELLSQQEKQYNSLGWFTILLSSTLVIKIGQYVDINNHISAISIHAITYGLNDLIESIHKHLYALSFSFHWSDHLSVLRFISSVRMQIKYALLTVNAFSHWYLISI